MVSSTPSSIHSSSAASAATPEEALSINGPGLLELPDEIILIILSSGAKLDMSTCSDVPLVNKRFCNLSAKIPYRLNKVYIYRTILERLKIEQQVEQKRGNLHYVPYLPEYIKIDSNKGFGLLEGTIDSLKNFLDKQAILSDNMKPFDISVQLMRTTSILEEHMTEFPDKVHPLFQKLLQIDAKYFFKPMLEQFNSPSLKCFYKALETYCKFTQRQDDLAKIHTKREDIGCFGDSCDDDSDYEPDDDLYNMDSAFDRDIQICLIEDDSDIQVCLENSNPVQECLELLKDKFKERMGAAKEFGLKVFSKLQPEPSNELYEMCMSLGLDCELFNWYLSSKKYDLALELYEFIIQKLRKEKDYPINKVREYFHEYFDIIRSMKESRSPDLKDLLSKIFLKAEAMIDQILQQGEPISKSLYELLVVCYFEGTDDLEKMKKLIDPKSIQTFYPANIDSHNFIFPLFELIKWINATFYR